MASDFQVISKSVDTEKLESELARRVEERKKAGLYTHEIESALAEPLPLEDSESTLPPIADLDYAATRASVSWEVTAAYPVETQKKRARRLVIFVKRVLRLWARLSVGPMQARQMAFNRHVVTALNALVRHAKAEREKEKAQEADLALLAECMVSEEETNEFSEAIATKLGNVKHLTIVGPCNSRLADKLKNQGYSISVVSSGSTWEEVGLPPNAMLTKRPFTFLSQLPEESQEAILVCELAFWLKPETLIGLLRKTYLSLVPGGLLAIAVHSFANTNPSPQWSSAKVIEKAMSVCGFSGVEILHSENGNGKEAHWYLALGQRPE
ncbi:MAG: hypothetical protein PHO53_00660 [Actinomycetota bacterium]|nr:hypothetical protein [Actinomycetota bacterium]